MPIRKDWSDAKLALCRPEAFSVNVLVADKALWSGLSDEDKARMYWKLELVERMAAKLAANMLKGTLKYTPEGETGSIAYWSQHLLDESVDVLNYAMLLEQELQRMATESLRSTPRYESA